MGKDSKAKLLTASGDDTTTCDPLALQNLNHVYELK
jgi:hypothetical protein